MKYLSAVVIILIIVAVCFAIALRPFVVNPKVFGFADVNVSDTAIVLSNGSFAGSSIWYSGYKVQYQAGVLSVEVYARSFKVFGVTNDPFTISIPNTYGSIQEVVLTDGAASDNRIVWRSSS